MFYKKTSDRAITPTRNGQFDAGMDLYGLEDICIEPGEIVKIRTGIHVAAKPTDVILFWEKSGRAWDMKNDRPVGLKILGGCCDGPYRGELIIIATNANIHPHLKLISLHTVLGVGFRQLTDEATLKYQEAERAFLTSRIVIPYGKAVCQFLHFDKILFTTLEELPAEKFDQLVTQRGEKGFGSSDDERPYPGKPTLKEYNEFISNEQRVKVSEEQEKVQQIRKRLQAEAKAAQIETYKPKRIFHDIAFSDERDAWILPSGVIIKTDDMRTACSLLNKGEHVQLVREAVLKNNTTDKETVKHCLLHYAFHDEENNVHGISEFVPTGKLFPGAIYEEARGWKVGDDMYISQHEFLIGEKLLKSDPGNLQMIRRFMLMNAARRLLNSPSMTRDIVKDILEKYSASEGA